MFPCAQALVSSRSGFSAAIHHCRLLVKEIIQYLKATKGSTCFCRHKQRAQAVLWKEGLVPIYRKKKDFGPVPSYLSKWNEEKERVTQGVAEGEANIIQPLPEEEKEMILQDLKEINWFTLWVSIPPFFHISFSAL